MKTISILLICISLACARENLKDINVACLFETSGFLFDFTQLANTEYDYNLTSPAGKVITFNFCRNLVNSCTKPNEPSP